MRTLFNFADKHPLAFFLILGIGGTILCSWVDKL